MAYDFPNAPTVGQAYSGYVWDGEKWVATAAPPNQSGVIGIQVFTTSGTYTPSASMTTCVIECQGGGGGGGGVTGTVTNVYVFSGGGGGSGGYSRKTATASAIGISQSVTIGAGGNGGAAGSNSGSVGGDTSVGSLCTAKGGSGGIFGAQAAMAAGGAGGVVGTGDVATTGQPGGGGVYSVATVFVGVSSNFGGSTVFGGGARGPAISGGAATAGIAAAANTGGGGSGANAASVAVNAAGGNGGSGLVVITEYGMTALSPTAAQLGSVRYDLPQGLTANQTAQARANIWVTKKNYIINGGMQISQENGATAGTTNFYYPVDMFALMFSNAGTQTTQQIASLTPGGSTNRIRVTATVADASVAAGDYSGITVSVEGLRWADLKSGSAAAKTITIQFGVKAPAGTYCITVKNGGTRSYVSEYVVAAGEANTDVVKSVTLTLDTTGTWASDNTAAVIILWSLMMGTTFQTTANAWQAGNFNATANQFNFMGTAGNVFELFDVSLTEGSVAPPFQVPDYPSELALCKRYWNIIYNYYVPAVAQAGLAFIVFPTHMRTNPTIGGGAAGFSGSAAQPTGAAVWQTTAGYQNLTFTARI